METLGAHHRSEVAGTLTAMAVMVFSFALHAQQVTVLKNVNVIDGTGPHWNAVQPSSLKATVFARFRPARHRRLPARESST